MGAYSESVHLSLPGATREPALEPGSGWVVVTAMDPSPEQVRAMLPTPPRVLVLSPTTSREDRGEVAFGRVLPGPPPRLADDALVKVRDGYRAAVLLDGIEAASGRVLMELSGAGVRRVAWRDGAGWIVAPTRTVAVRKPLRRLERRLSGTRVASWYRRRVERLAAHLALKERNRQRFPGETHWLGHLDRIGPRPAPPRQGDRLDIALYIGQLNSGGAERQLVNLATGLVRRGHAVRVLTTYPLTDENAHYCDDLHREGLLPRVAGEDASPAALEALRALQIHPEVVGSLPEVIRAPVLDLAGELLRHPPHVLHCWLDYPNVIGAAAAALVGTPHVLLSTRNVNPTYFPAFYQSWMDTWYGFFTTLPRVHVIANSEAGRDDYARWLGVEDEGFQVVRNGVDFSGQGDDAGARQALRDELGLAPGRRLVAGVFRLASEKQPLLFLDVVDRVRRAVSDLCVVMVGVGEMRAAVEAEIEDRGLGQVVRLLGQRRDVAAILEEADATLLTSAVEGTPNVVLESQWLGTPVVATAAGGTPEAVKEGVTGFLHPRQDTSGLSRSVVRLLRDPELRASMGQAGRAFVKARFGLDRMVDETLACYRDLVDGETAADPVAGPVAEAVAEATA